MSEHLERLAVNGQIIHCAVCGEGKPVLLVHGNGEDHHLFGTEIRQLADAGYRVIAPDSRGHGANAPLEEYHYADMAEDVFQLIRALKLERPALYGHSDGGIIGLLLALDHPEALSLLAVSGTNLSPDGLKPEWLERFRREYAESRDPLYALMLAEPHINPEDLRRIGIPVLVTAGSGDLIRESETRAIASHLPHSRLVIVPGHDHGSYIDGSPVMGELLLDFLRQNGY